MPTLADALRTLLVFTCIDAEIYVVFNGYCLLIIILRSLSINCIQIGRRWRYPTISPGDPDATATLAMLISPLGPSMNCLLTFCIYIFSPGYLTFRDVWCFDEFCNKLSDALKKNI